MTTIKNAFKIGDRVKLWTGSPRPLPDDLVIDHEYVVQATVLDRVQIKGQLYYASRFILIGEQR